MAVRVRKKDVTTWANANGFVTYWNQNSQQWWLNSYPSLSGAVMRRVETMEDDYPHGGKMKPERSCHHDRLVLESVGGPIGLLYPSSNLYVEYPSDAFRSYASGLPATFSDFATPGSVSLPDMFPDWLMENDIAGPAWQGLPFLGELHSTIRMLKNPLSFLKSLKVPRGMRDNPVGSVLKRLGLGKASSGWLAWKYGWSPLFNDLKKLGTVIPNMSNDYQRYLDGDQVWQKVRLSKELGVVEQNSASTYGLTTRRSSHRCKLTFEYRVKPAAEVGYVLSYPNYCARRLGLGLDSLALTAWELAPYSFVADWFIPVGDVLTGLTHSPCFAEFRKQSYHHTIHRKTEVSLRFDANAFNGKAQKPQALMTVLKATSDDYYRNWTGHNPGNSYSSSGMSTQRTISALSLLAQRLMFPISRR